MKKQVPISTGIREHPDAEATSSREGDVLCL